MRLYLAPGHANHVPRIPTYMHLGPESSYGRFAVLLPRGNCYLPRRPLTRELNACVNVTREALILIIRSRWVRLYQYLFNLIPE